MQSVGAGGEELSIGENANSENVRAEFCADGFTEVLFCPAALRRWLGVDCIATRSRTC